MAGLRGFPWKEHLRPWAAAFVQQSRRSVGYLPALCRKPSLLLHVLKSATLVHAVAFASVLIMIFVAPSLTRGVASVFHSRPKGPMSLVGKQTPQAKATGHGLLTAMWIGTGCAWLLLLWLHIPRAMADAAKRSGRSERKADALRRERPGASVLLYQSALALAADPRDEEDLLAKIRLALSESGGPERTVIGGSEPPRVPLWRRAGRALAKPFRAEPEFVVGKGGRYQLDKPLGQGGMGTVYVGVDTKLGRKVAIKGLPEGPAQGQDFIARFHQEAKALAALCHPGIVQVYDLVAEHGRVWIVLEYVEGGDLAAHLRQSGPLGIAEAARLGQLCAEALHHAHQRGVVHRDFKPANVLLGAGGIPKITDFGLARLLGTDGLTQTGTILGSAPYMSPEQARGLPADERADVYSLGITIYEMTAGVTPFTGDPASVLAQHLTQPPPPLAEKCPEAPAELSELLNRMLVKDPLARLADLNEVCAVLQPLSAGRAWPGALRSSSTR
jgi:hypothetical protein